MHPDPHGSPPPPRSDSATPEDEGEVLAQVLTLKEHDESAEYRWKTAIGSSWSGTIRFAITCWRSASISR